MSYVDPEDRECLQIAIEMVSDEEEFNIELLAPGLTNKLVEIDNLCRRVNGILRSRQIIAYIIWEFKKDNPGLLLYKEALK